MKKKNIRPLILSSLAALAMAGIGTGATFALFTDKAETTIQVESGIVNVNQELEILSVSELNDVAVAANEGVYINSVGGKTYVDSTTGALKLEKWVPGDKAVIKVTNKNESDVKIKTRFMTRHGSTSTPDLFDALKITYAFEAGYSNEITEENYDEWTLLSVPQTENHAISAITITIEFPDTDNGEIKFGNENNDNIYQNTNCEIYFSQEAVQGNAYIPDTSKGYADTYEEQINNVAYTVNLMDTAEHFEKMLTDLKAVDASNAEEVAAAQKTIYRLNSDIDLTGASDLNKGTLYGTLDGQGHKIHNVDIDSDAGATGIIASYYDGAAVKNLALDDIEIKGTENVGALFGQSYYHAKGDVTDTVPGSELTFENVTIGSNVLISGTKGLGGIAGSTRWVEKITLKNCVNNADVSAEIYNVGGFFGTLAGVKTINIDGCVNNGNIRGTHNVAGFVGQSPALTSITIKNSENHGRITDFSKHNSEANAGWFIATKANNATLNYSNNINDGKIYYVSENASILNVFEKDLVGNGIAVGENKTANDYMVLDDTVVLAYTIENNQFNVTPVSGADHYSISMQVWGRDVTLAGNTATVVKEKYLSYSQSYVSVDDLKLKFGHITRAGYFLNSTYTEYAYDPDAVSNSSTINGRANFFRLPYAQKANYSVFNKPYFDSGLNEWVYILDSEADCLPGAGHILSPKNTSVTYYITAYDANNHVIASSVHRDDAKGMNPNDASDVSGSYLKNMNGDVFNSASPNTETGTKVYDPVA